MYFSWCHVPVRPALDVELALTGDVVAARTAGIRAAYDASLSMNMYEQFCKRSSFFCNGSMEIEFNRSTGFLVDCHATGRLTQVEAELVAERELRKHPPSARMNLHGGGGGGFTSEHTGRHQQHGHAQSRRTNAA